jgi:hypothetical protein
MPPTSAGATADSQAREHDLGLGVAEAGVELDDLDAASSPVRMRPA